MSNENKSGLEVLAKLVEDTKMGLTIREFYHNSFVDIGNAAFKSKDVETLWFTSFDVKYRGFDGFEAPGGDRMVEITNRLWYGQPTPSDANSKDPGRHLIAQTSDIQTEEFRTTFETVKDKGTLSQIMGVPYDAAPGHNPGENPRTYRLK